MRLPADDDEALGEEGWSFRTRCIQVIDRFARAEASIFVLLPFEPPPPLDVEFGEKEPPAPPAPEPEEKPLTLLAREGNMLPVF